jgi:hypothetical protein
MQIIDTDVDPTLVSDFEVLCILQEHSQRAPSAGFTQDAQTIEYETLSYLSDVKMSPVSTLTGDKFCRLMSYLSTLKLTKMERLQIVNRLPRTFIDFYVLVEECEERFPQQQVEQEILAEIERIIDL